MKVGIVLSQPFDQSIGTDVRVRGLITGLSKLGVQTYLITPFAEDLSRYKVHVYKLPSQLTRLGISNITYRLARYLFYNRYLCRCVGPRKFFLNSSIDSFVRGLHRIIQDLGLDIIQGEQEIASLACIRACKDLSVPTIADFHGIWAEEMVAAGLIRLNSPQYNAIYSIMQEIVHESDALITVSEEMMQYLREAFNVYDKIVEIVPNASFPKIREKESVNNPSKVVYAGMVCLRENLDLFVRAMPLVKKQYPLVEFYLTRKGERVQDVESLAQSLGIRPRFIWYPNSRDFFNFLKMCHVGVIPASKHKWRQMATPAKLYDYLSVGVPVVAVDIGASWTRAIAKHKVGILTEPTPESFSYGILELLKNPTMIFEYGQRGLELVKKELNYYRSAEKLLKVYEYLK